ncbi:shikimate kinase [Corynebacterium sp. MNWGS58]|uniref:shikimate kinase n=1 Tax=Corynebacterium sp. 102791.4 TaxID=3104612 RepID=UPI003513A287
MSTENTRPAVVLIGPPGAGKTTIGRRLARVLNQQFVDSDSVIEQKAGKTCSEIFAESGEEYFRTLEAEVIADALQEPGILALGGGAVTNAGTRSLLEEQTVVFVDVSDDTGIERTTRPHNRHQRPLLAGADAGTRYRRLMAQRRPLYREVADYRARTDQRSPQQVVADILGFLETL